MLISSQVGQNPRKHCPPITPKAARLSKNSSEILETNLGLRETIGYWTERDQLKAAGECCGVLRKFLTIASTRAPPLLRTALIYQENCGGFINHFRTVTANTSSSSGKSKYDPQFSNCGHSNQTMDRITNNCILGLLSIGLLPKLSHGSQA